MTLRVRFSFGAAYTACMVVVALTATKDVARVVGEFGIAVGVALMAQPFWHAYRDRRRRRAEQR